MDDFEAIWRKRVRKALHSHGYGHLWDAVHFHMKDGGNSPEAFTVTLLDTLQEHVNHCAGSILNDCACHTSHEDLEDLRVLWRKTHDLRLVHSGLQAQFIAFIRGYKNLNDAQVGDLVRRGWGMAGILEGTHITATKIPAMYHEYFAADDPAQKRYCYCHCPRIKDILCRGAIIDPLYCHCGMGFYLDIWSYILEHPVKGELIASILRGDAVCSFHLDVS